MNRRIAENLNQLSLGRVFAEANCGDEFGISQFLDWPVRGGACFERR
jgi:hypothetical protein